MRIHLYVVPFPVSRFQTDRGESYLVLWSVAAPGACRHVIDDPPACGRQSSRPSRCMSA